MTNTSTALLGRYGSGQLTFADATKYILRQPKRRQLPLMIVTLTPTAYAKLPVALLAYNISRDVFASRNLRRYKCNTFCAYFSSTYREIFVAGTI